VRGAEWNGVEWGGGGLVVEGEFGGRRGGLVIGGVGGVRGVGGVGWRVIGCDEFGKEERGHGGGVNGEGVIVGSKVEEEMGGQRWESAKGVYLKDGYDRPVVKLNKTAVR